MDGGGASRARRAEATATSSARVSRDVAPNGAKTNTRDSSSSTMSPVERIRRSFQGSRARFVQTSWPRQSRSLVPACAAADSTTTLYVGRPLPLGRTRGRAPLEPHDRRRGHAPFAAVSVVGERHDPEKCESELDDITSRTPMVKFLLEALSKAGCPVKREFFEVQYCSQAVLGVPSGPGGGVVSQQSHDSDGHGEHAHARARPRLRSLQVRDEPAVRPSLREPLAPLSTPRSAPP